MKLKKKLRYSALAIGLLALAGCASLPPGLNSTPAYSPSALRPQNAQRVQQVRIGRIVGLVPVMIKASRRERREGSGLGAALGGILGHGIGRGRGKKLATIAGVIGGAVGGNVATQHMYQVEGEQVTVQLRGGSTVAITQAIPRVPLHVHERVEIVGSGWGGSAARVLPLPASVQSHP